MINSVVNVVGYHLTIGSVKFNKEHFICTSGHIWNAKNIFSVLFLNTLTTTLLCYYIKIVGL